MLPDDGSPARPRISPRRDAAVPLSRRAFLTGAAAAAAVASVAAGGGLTGAAAARAAEEVPDPDAWGGYENGRIPLSALVAIDYPRVVAGQTPGGEHVDHVYLEPRAAADLLVLLASYHEERFGYLPVVEGYRSFANQQYWWEFYGHDETLARPPGTSRHGWGKAVDFTDALLTDDHVAWLKEKGPRFHYFPIQTERWHFTHVAPPTTVPSSGTRAA